MGLKIDYQLTNKVMEEEVKPVEEVEVEGEPKVEGELTATSTEGVE